MKELFWGLGSDAISLGGRTFFLCPFATRVFDRAVTEPVLPRTLIGLQLHFVLPFLRLLFCVPPPYLTRDLQVVVKAEPGTHNYKAGVPTGVSFNQALT